MNKSHHKLLTLDSEEPQSISLHEQKYKQFAKNKKQSSRKISLKQSGMKEVKDFDVYELVPKRKKSHQASLMQSHQKSKIIKDMEQSKPSQEWKVHSKAGNLSKQQNKSLILSQQKLTNPHHYSILKSTTANKPITSQSKYLTKEKQYQPQKKQSIKGSTTKKHSKSVYNYTQFDEYPIECRKRKQSTKQHLAGRKSRDSHNKSAMTQQGHQISTSSITKRAYKSKDILNKLLNSSEIRKKTDNFKILSNCLKEYIHEEESLNNKIDVGQIIKMVRAFNKTEISQMSKPLEQLIYQIVSLIQQTVEKQKHQKQHQRISELKDQKRFETPQRLSKRQQQTFPSSIHQPKTDQFHNQSSVVLTPNDISKTKKFTTDNYDQIHNLSLSKDLIKMEHGLEQLKSESKQIKRAIRESSNKKTSKQQQSENEQIQEKKIEIHRLKQVLERQKYLIQKIEHYEESESEQSSKANNNVQQENDE